MSPSTPVAERYAIVLIYNSILGSYALLLLYIVCCAFKKKSFHFLLVSIHFWLEARVNVYRSASVSTTAVIEDESVMKFMRLSFAEVCPKKLLGFDPVSLWLHSARWDRLMIRGSSCRPGKLSQGWKCLLGMFDSRSGMHVVHVCQSHAWAVHLCKVIIYQGLGFRVLRYLLCDCSSRKRHLMVVNQ